MWAGFETRFSTILRRLAYHGELMDKEATAVDISDAVKRNKEEDEKWSQQESEWQATKVRTVLSWLGANDSLPEDALERHTQNCLPSSCDWFIQHRKTQLWLKDGTENVLIWLNGKPGAGQSLYALGNSCAYYCLQANLLYVLVLCNTLRQALSTFSSTFAAT